VRQRVEPGGSAGANFECPFSACLEPLREGQNVFLFDGPVTINNVEFWKIVDREFPGCCAPLGWVPAANDHGPVLAPYGPHCPDASQPLPAQEIVALGGLATLVCFGSTDLELRGTIMCTTAVADGPYFATGAPWIVAPDDPYCWMGDAGGGLGLSGDPTRALAGDSNPAPTYINAAVFGHFDDPASTGCHWTPGNLAPIDTEGAPEEPAVFWCRTHFVVSRVEISGR
jgi:hypothetical protein